MAKKGALGALFLLGGYDLSGDIGALSALRMSRAPLDVTAINVSAYERILGLADGEISFNCFFNKATSQEHARLSGLSTADQHALFIAGQTLGDVGFGIIGKQINYDWTRGQDGALLGTVQVLGNGKPLLAGQMLTAGKRTDTSATTGTGVDQGTATALAVTITSSSVANPTVITTAAPHGLVTGDSVIIAGHSGSTPAVNGSYTATVTGASTFTVPVNVSSGGTGGTVTKTSTNFGGSAFVQVTAFSGTDVTVKLQHSPDNSTFADITGGAFTQITAAPAVEYIQLSATRIVQEFIRVTTTTSGGVTSVTFAVLFVRYFNTAPTW